MRSRPFKFNRNIPLNQFEAKTYYNMYKEVTDLYGSDVVYIEREPLGEEPIFGEYLASVLKRGTEMRMIVEETDQWGGMGDVYTKFGLKVADEITCYCPVGTMTDAREDLYPKYQDLIFHVPSQKLYEISHIENEIAPGFYLFGNKPGYKFTCRLYIYDHNDVDTEDDIIPEAIRRLSIPLDDEQSIEDLDVMKNNAKIDAAVESEGVIDNTEVSPFMK